MTRKWLTLAFVSAAIGLAACNREDKSPMQAEPEGARGSARIALPQLPAGFLVDSSQKALFVLDIVGPALDTIRRSSYILPGDPAHQLFVDRIPVGLNRFYGRLYRVDSAGRKVEQTHVGSDSAVISSYFEAQVHLVLRPSTGSAEVCVDVEGWPTDSSCVVLPPPPPPETLSVAGCYHLRVLVQTDPRVDRDSFFMGRLEIRQQDSNLIGIINWNAGFSDTARGLLFGRLFSIKDSARGLAFHGLFDSAGAINGWLSDSSRNISGTALADPPQSCLADTVPPPPPPPMQRDCYTFRQAQTNGKTVTGRLGLAFPPRWGGVYANVGAHWDGYGFRSGTAVMTGSPDSTASLDWNFAPPAGLFPAGIDSVSIVASITSQGGAGKIREYGDTAKALGTWTAIHTACLDSDFVP